MWGLTDENQLVEYVAFDAVFGLTSDKKPIRLDMFFAVFEYKDDALKKQHEMKYKRISQCLYQYCQVIKGLTEEVEHKCRFEVHVLYEGDLYCGTQLSPEFVGLYERALNTIGFERMMVEVDKCTLVGVNFEQVYTRYRDSVIGICSQALREMANELST